MTTGKPQITLH